MNTHTRIYTISVSTLKLTQCKPEQPCELEMLWTHVHCSTNKASALRRMLLVVAAVGCRARCMYAWLVHAYGLLACDMVREKCISRFTFSMHSVRPHPNWQTDVSSIAFPSPCFGPEIWSCFCTLDKTRIRFFLDACIVPVNSFPSWLVNGWPSFCPYFWLPRASSPTLQGGVLLRPPRLHQVSRS